MLGSIISLFGYDPYWFSTDDKTEKSCLQIGQEIITLVFFCSFSLTYIILGTNLR